MLGILGSHSQAHHWTCPDTLHSSKSGHELRPACSPGAHTDTHLPSNILQKGLALPGRMHAGTAVPANHCPLANSTLPAGLAGIPELPLTQRCSPSTATQGNCYQAMTPYSASHLTPASCGLACAGHIASVQAVLHSRMTGSMRLKYSTTQHKRATHHITNRLSAA